MRRALPSVLIASLGILCTGLSQAQFTDDFSDLDFTSGVVWSGSTTLFTAATGALQSQSPGAANYYLSTPSTLATNAQWDYFINLKFATSGANYADVYLVSSAADLQSGVNGYFVRFGGTADRVELFRSDAGVNTSLIASPDGIVNSSTDNPFNIRVLRDAGNNWTLLYDDGLTGTFSPAGTIVDAAYTTSTSFGVRIEQSTAASAVNNHFFDNIAVGAIAVDNTPPSLLSATVISATQIDVLFSEPVDQATAETTSNYNIIPFNSASSVTRDGTNLSLAHVVLTTAMQNGNTYTVTVNGVQDLFGNACANEVANVLYFIPDAALPGDVIINEVMADPTPAVGLPEAEFVEVFNRTTNKTFDLANWTITDGSSTGTLPSLALPPGGFVILTTTTSASSFTSYGPVLGVPSFPSLNNDGDLVSLKNDASLEIDAITYDLGWYHDNVKAQGGWTIERIDPTSPCSNTNNWTASIAPSGGTPGAQNSVYAIVTDNTPPALINVFVNSATQIELQFSETMNTLSLASGNYVTDPSLSIDLAIPVGTDRVQLTFASGLVAGQLYTITVTSVSDCPGNTIGAQNTLTFALPEAVDSGDVVINEVLYDPIGTGSDFVELYNRSSKVLSLANWKLAHTVNGVVADPAAITSSAFLLLPGTYALITANTSDIVARYPQSHVDRFVQTTMPTYNNGNGTVVLEDPNGALLDRFDYNDNLHFALLNATEGVSLERVSPDRPTSDNTNWHSAAQDAGSATPGFQNSQFSETNSANGELDIEHRMFSPDNDGYEDVLTVAYRFNAPGFTGTMKVFDIAGREVKILLNNELLGTTGAISWDGIMTTGDLARMGPYVIYFEAFDLGGNVEKFRETVVLAHKLD